METLMPSIPGREVGTASVVKGIWGRSRTFLIHIVMVILVGLFMRFYVDGRQFFLSHDLPLHQADGSITRIRVVPPVQRDITTIISILASTARAAATLWIAGIDLRCIFLFMKRGGVTFEGLQSMFGRSLPGRRHFWQKTNYIILLILHGGIVLSTYTSSVLAGSVTWKPASLYKPGQPITGIPLGQTGDPVRITSRAGILDAFVTYSTAIYSIFYGDVKSRYSPFMHRLLPDNLRFLPIGSSFDELTVPYFAVNAFDWIKNPNSTLTPRQLNATLLVNTTGPRVMTLRKWGFIPDETWGPSERAFPAALTRSESRILVISAQETSKCEFGYLGRTIPDDVQPLISTFNGLPTCFIFANVTYQAGAARSRRCQTSRPNVIEDVGDVKSLQLIDDPVTSVALGIAPYVSTSLFDSGYALPFGPRFPTMEAASIEILSRSYQVAWNGLTSTYGISKTESSKVLIAVDASTASVLMWRVVLWGLIHATLVAFGFIFRLLHTRGRFPWIDDPVTAALLVDPTPLMNDQRTWAGKDAPHIAGMLKLKQKGANTYLVLEEPEGEDKV